jgi:hypothetical protein
VLEETGSVRLTTTVVPPGTKIEFAGTGPFVGVVVIDAVAAGAGDRIGAPTLTIGIAQSVAAKRNKKMR